ncbi:sushi domain-containing protein 6 [Megalops cyprinoides]|uniref:sushi domain-containing protein 6 n=1 Tax=Megalops cyprinoides TaxID=118141 RepID=UPI0018656188|nr:sushi domain-containing protein 6 [Megalops cyprinoides]XP_036392349.1 sushi domain-containing protein 6 [Megalops cyprinoides]
MSARGLLLRQCVHSALGRGVLILVILPALATGKQWNNCSHPMVPEHGGFRCDPSPCRGFPPKSTIHYFCEPGYSLPPRVHSSRCRHGRWSPSVPTCVPNPGGRTNTEDRTQNSLPSVATTAVGVSIFLLTTTACMVIKSRLYPCHSHSRRSSDQMDLMVDGLPVSLPTYEEAMYGSWGQRLPPCRGPTQLLLAQESPGSDSVSSHVQSEPGSPHQSAELPPPPYEEIPSCPRGAHSEESRRARQIELPVEKDN